MTTSDWIAISAFVISIVFSFLNFLYTRRTFRVANYPALQIILQLTGEMGDSTFYAKLINLSSSIYATEVKVSYSLSELSKPWRFWQRKQTLWYESDFDIIAPGKDTANSLPLRNKPLSIEAFLEKKFPHLVEEKVSAYEGKMTLYRLRQIGFGLTITARYRPGIQSANIISVKRFYVLRAMYPEETEPSYYRVYGQLKGYWDTTEH